jgi:hypothetical protein
MVALLLLSSSLALANVELGFQETLNTLENWVPVGRSMGTNSEGRPCQVEFQLEEAQATPNGMEGRKASLAIWNRDALSDVAAPGARRQGFVELRWDESVSFESRESTGESAALILEFRQPTLSASSTQDPHQIRITVVGSGIQVTLRRGAQAAWLAGLRPAATQTCVLEHP